MYTDLIDQFAPATVVTSLLLWFFFDKKKNMSASCKAEISGLWLFAAIIAIPV